MADLIAPLPIIRLYGGMVLKLEAISPTTGAPVAGVTVEEVAIYGRSLTTGAEDEPLLPVYLLSQDV